ncbi:uncharacterized protein Z519_01137 [Cladophialophora bantiana CBS 173.52]|uniref:Uncharacterized protein n=1 Tax=Cladophialophora bantiana (strain ATCC 10958 / CBS 173.52 / CDC B-1940 / NIH 8579) TaxID=1442370 RepID=A0A0D2HW40_CLAB1|nr:uncharacterized protein Z519_01137 [Cladophialophora bantiana CBS 173.52]KIW97553.1 hypothetical protein Z519_01137 [Cladophialophora bantiana CBS 173.52]
MSLHWIPSQRDPFFHSRAMHSMQRQYPRHVDGDMGYFPTKPKHVHTSLSCHQHSSTGPSQWPGTAQDQNTSPLQHDQHAEHTDRPAAPQQRLAVLPEDINQFHPNYSPAENGNRQPEQPRPSRQVPIELLDEVCADMDDLNLATAVQLAHDDPRLDSRAAMEQQAIIAQHIHDRPLMQPEEWRTGSGEGVLYYRLRHGSCGNGMQVEGDRLVVREAHEPFGLSLDKIR